jgi:PAS domain S-box-containing protein
MDGRVIKSNPALERMLGYSSAELRGKPFYEFTHPDDVMNEKLLIEGLLSGHRDHYDIEKRYIRKDGQVINVQFKGSFIGDEEGKPIAGIALIEDITERRKEEEALKKAHENLEEKVKERTVELEQAYNSLKESEKGLADAQRIAHIGSWEWNLLNNKISWSDEMYRIFGLKPQEELSFDKILNYIHPEDRDYLRDAHQEALKGEKPSILIEVRIVSADEEKRIINGCSEVIFNEENKPVQMIGTVQDITELKKAEETLCASEARFRSLYENSLDGILLTKPDGTILSANPQACSLFSMTEDEIIKAGRDGLVADEEKLAAALAERRRTGLFKAELTHRRKDGSTFLGEVSSGPFFVDLEGVTTPSHIIRDITERKRTEEIILELANIVESSNDAIITRSLDGIITSWNKGAEQIYGYSAEEILGKCISILEPEELKGEIKQLADKVKKGERVRHYETLRLKKDGTKINISVALSPVFDINGKLTAISVIARDITRRKKAEQALKLSEERYRIVAEQTGQLVYDYDVEKNDVCWAGNIKEFTGYDPEKFRNMTLSRESRVHPEDLDKLQNKIKKYMKYGGNYLSEYRLRKSNGSYIFVEDNGVCLKNEKGNVNRVLGTIKNITERKLSQERLEISERKYRSFIENFKGIVYQADENYIPQFLHGAVEEITGYSEEEFMAKRPWKEIIDPEYLPIIHNDELKLRASTDIRTLEREFRIKNRKGNTKWIHETFQKIPGENGKTIYQGVLYDITERKQAEEALVKYEIAKKKEIHHRIKNNLQIISALLDLQAEKLKGRTSVSTSELLNAFKECQDRVISMALIHEELYKGGETDKLNFSSYVRKLAENLILAYTVGNKDISLDVDLEESTFFNVDTAVPLGIIVNEIVSNSFKYAFSGRDKGEIRIKLHREKEGECKKEGCKTKSYVLSLSDNGVGIPEDLDIENLDSLGLQLVTSLVDQLNGQLEIKRGNGTEFIIRFNSTEKNNPALKPASESV